MPDVHTLTEKRNRLVAEARQITEKAEAEKRDPTAEERSKFDEIMGDVATTKADIDRMVSLEKHEAEAAEARDRADREAGERRQTPGEQPGREKRDAREVVVEHRGRKITLREGDARFARSTDEARTAYAKFLTGQDNGAEYRDLSSSNPIEGGYLNAPMQMATELIKELDDAVFVRSLARVFSIEAESMGAPKRTGKLSNFTWGAELTQTTPDSALQFGQRELTPHYATQEIKTSRNLLRSAAMSVEGIIVDELRREYGENTEQAYMTGNGVSQPLGVFTASDKGISTARDVSTGNTTTAIAADNLISVKYSLKEQYRRNAVWVFHRDGVAMISKLKDSEGQYLWQPGLRAGDPDTVLGNAIRETEFGPNTFTAGQYVGIFGDFSNYWIADNLNLEIQTLVELYARTNQIAHIARFKTDGMPVLEEGFARVQLASA